MMAQASISKEMVVRGWGSQGGDEQVSECLCPG